MMGQTLLVADDSKTMRQLVTMAFKGSAYQVITVNSGAAALQAAYEHKPTVIVLDYHLPDRSGLDVCRALKGDPSLRQIPVLMMGGKYHPFNADEARQHGSDAVIMKPFKTDEIHQHVKTLTGGAPAPQAARPQAAATPQALAPKVPSAPPVPPGISGSRTPVLTSPPPLGSTGARPTPPSAPPLAAAQQRVATASPASPFGQPAQPAAAASQGSLTRETPAPSRSALNLAAAATPASRHTAPTANQARYPSRLPTSGGGAGSKLPPPSRYPGSRPGTRSNSVIPPAPAVAPSPVVTAAPPGVATPLSAAAPASAPAVSFDREEMRKMVRDEVQSAVRAEMLTMVKSVLGDLFKEKMMPKLLSYGQERIEAIVARDLQDIMERRVEEELAKLTHE